MKQCKWIANVPDELMNDDINKSPAAALMQLHEAKGFSRTYSYNISREFCVNAHGKEIRIEMVKEKLSQYATQD